MHKVIEVNKAIMSLNGNIYDLIKYMRKQHLQRKVHKLSINLIRPLQSTGWGLWIYSNHLQKYLMTDWLMKAHLG